MHLAPRVLQSAGCCSEGTTVTRSLLASRNQAIPSTKLFMNPQVKKVAERHADVAIGIYVDDAGHHAVGTCGLLIRKLAAAAADFAGAMKALRMKIAGNKSVVVASSKLVALVVAGKPAKAGVEVKVASSARDLGLMLNPGRIRRTALTTARLSKAKVRLAKITKLSQVNRAARRLAAAGGLAAGTWGQAALGPDPCSIRQAQE